MGLSDVARRAGVSTASVSRVLNSPERVSPATRSRVETAIAELGYIPHGAARALASRRTRTIGAIVPTLDNAIFAACISALQRRLKQAGYTLLLACSDYQPQEELRECLALLGRGVEGVMLVGARHDPRLYALLADKAVPHVDSWVHDPASVHPCIGFDNRRAAARITEHLLALGHRRIAMVAGQTRHNDRAADRVVGVCETLRARGLDWPGDYLIEQPYGIAEGREALRRLWTLRPRPTAVIGGNDVLAFGVLLEALAAGIRVPQDLSVTGFDDLPLASHIQPPLTTLRVPSAGIGTLAGDYLLARIAGETPPSRREVEVELVTRATTAAPGG
ncbi:MAG: LacI family DNA-binding transcriptional regulator [Candidatus Competibacterales bacterium]|nr:LacI family DNA-binding transcriptional regulator [Candidatus Competibacterales bacterium]